MSVWVRSLIIFLFLKVLHIHSGKRPYQKLSLSLSQVLHSGKGPYQKSLSLSLSLSLSPLLHDILDMTRMCLCMTFFGS